MKSMFSLRMKLTFVLAVILCGATIAAEENTSTVTKTRSLQEETNHPIKPPTKPPTRQPTKHPTGKHPTRRPSSPPTKIPLDGSSNEPVAPTKRPTFFTKPPTFFFTRPAATSSPSKPAGNPGIVLAPPVSRTSSPSKGPSTALPTLNPTRPPTNQPTASSNPYWWSTYLQTYGLEWSKCVYLKRQQRNATQGARCRILKSGAYFCAQGSQYACGREGVPEYEYPTERCDCIDGIFDKCSPIELPADLDCSATN